MPQRTRWKNRRRLTGRCRSGRKHDLSRILHVGMTAFDEEVTEVKRGIDSATVDAAFFCVVIQLPFQIAVASGAHAYPGNNRRKASWVGEECYPGEVHRCVQHISATIHHHAA